MYRGRLKFNYRITTSPNCRLVHDLRPDLCIRSVGETDQCASITLGAYLYIFFAALIARLPEDAVLYGILLQSPHLLFLQLTSFFPDLCIHQILFQPLVSLNIGIRLRRCEIRCERREQFRIDRGKKRYIFFYRYCANFMTPVKISE